MTQSPNQISYRNLITNSYQLVIKNNLNVADKVIIFKNTTKYIIKKFASLKKGVTFVSTVPVLLPIRTAHGSFFFIGLVKVFNLQYLSRSLHQSASSFKCPQYV